MAKRGASVNVEVEGLRETLRAFNRYGRDANKELREAAMHVAKATAEQAKSKGTGLSELQSLAASTITAKSDRTPKVVGGGTRKVGRRRTPAGAIFFGAEFGGGGRPTTRQFPPHRGNDGYFLWPTIRARADNDVRLYMRALDQLNAKWARGG